MKSYYFTNQKCHACCQVSTSRANVESFPSRPEVVVQSFQYMGVLSINFQITLSNYEIINNYHVRSTDRYSVANALRRVHVRIVLHVLGSVQMEHCLLNSRVPNNRVSCEKIHIHIYYIFVTKYIQMEYFKSNIF